MNEKKTKNILAINFGGIGDEVLLLPTLISLKKEFPNSKITLALEPRSKGITTLTNTIDEVITVDIKRKNKYLELLKFIFKARLKNFDLGITAGGNKFVSIILFLTGAKKRYGYNTGILSQKLLTKTVELNKQQYAVKMYHDLVTPITNNTTELPQIKITPQEKIQNSILIHPGVSKMSVDKGMIKTVNATTWADTIKLFIEKGKTVMLAGGPDDEECINEILKQVNDDKLINYYGKTKSLKDLAELISSAEKFVCSDSAPMHIAVALGVKTYTIFGPTDDKKLAPPFVITLKTNDNCPIKPCLWEKRQTSCDNPICLNFASDDILREIL